MARKKNSAAQKLGRKGGKARAQKLTSEQRSDIARKAGLARQAKRRISVHELQLPQSKP